MDTIRIFGHRDQPPWIFLRSANGSELDIEPNILATRGFGINPSLFLQSQAYQFYYQDGLVQVMVWLDDEQTLSLELGVVPNCAGIHDWISRANQLFAKSR